MEDASSKQDGRGGAEIAPSFEVRYHADQVRPHSSYGGWSYRGTVYAQVEPGVYMDSGGKCQRLDPHWVGLNTLQVSEIAARLIEPQLFRVLGSPNPPWMDEKAKIVKGLLHDGATASLVIGLLQNQVLIGRIAARGLDSDDGEKSDCFWSIIKLSGGQALDGSGPGCLLARVEGIIKDAEQSNGLGGRRENSPSPLV